jgi:hypothetical protein
MVNLLSDGNFKVSWLLNVSNVHAPTVAELAAGTSLEQFITPDGYKNKASTAPIATSSLASTFDTEAAGRKKFDISLELMRQTLPDPVYALLAYKAAGYLAVRRTLANTTAWASTQQVGIFPVQCGQREESDAAENEVQTYTVPLFLTADPDDNAVVA